MGSDADRSASAGMLNGHAPSSGQLDELIQRLQEVTDSAAFYQAAERILQEATSPTILARSAEYAARREPGGPYYRALLWTRADELRRLSDGGFPRKTLGLLAIEAASDVYSVRTWILWGSAIRAAAAKCARAEVAGRAFVDLSSLRDAPAAVFQAAVAQKERAAEYLIEAASLLEENPRATAVQIHNRWCQDNGSIKANLDIIKPSDWWAFSHPKWRQEADFPGSIPGEVYANALYYFAPERGVAVDPMAGSGMLKRVYDDRDRWQRELSFDLEVHLFDLEPRRSFIKPHDARKPLPILADWVFLDPPYFGQSEHLYAGDLAATTSYADYLTLLHEVIVAAVASLNPSGRLCLFLPKWSGARPEHPNHNLPSDAATLAAASGLQWVDAAYVSRGRQQESGSAIKNNHAKRQRRMRSDTCVLNVFQKG